MSSSIFRILELALLLACLPILIYCSVKFKLNLTASYVVVSGNFDMSSCEALSGDFLSKILSFYCVVLYINSVDMITGRGSSSMGHFQHG